MTHSIPSTLTPDIIVNTLSEPVAHGPFQPTWTSLAQYRCPDWFTEAKFGIWAHWGPQCQPEEGDWYARNLYCEGSRQALAHLQRYGHPSKVGFKDVIHEWKAEKWDPEKLIALYQRVGAQYFFAMANHHDNFDLWDSQYQPWNSTKMGPGKDIIAGWAKATREHGMHFGVSIHAAHAWSWYESAQGADKEGGLAGVRYDGCLTKADGKGQWWEAFDPQDLYEQRHEPNSPIDESNFVGRWNWTDGANLPDQAYCDKFYNRTVDLVNACQPDLIYFDDNALPLWPRSDAGLKIAAHFYNANLQKTGGQSNGVLFGKNLTEDQLKCMTWDVERGVPSIQLQAPWQTDTCIGYWHYERGLYDRQGYKSASAVIHMLADIVSKNGNLLLSVPVRADGTLDELEEQILEEVAAWMAVNRECIFGTRPWSIFGEGPATDGIPVSVEGFSEGKGKPFTAEDVRFTVGKDGSIYAILMGWPEKPVAIRALGANAGNLTGRIASVELLGGPQVERWSQDADALSIEPPRSKTQAANAAVYKIACSS